MYNFQSTIPLHSITFIIRCPLNEYQSKVIIFSRHQLSMNKSIDKNSSQWTSSDGESFNYTYWSDNNEGADQPNVVLIAVHGLGGSANDFNPLGAHLAQKNIVIYAYEMRTQGNDPKVKRRGDLIDWHILTNDLKEFCNYVYTLYPKAKHILAGESMGARAAGWPDSRYRGCSRPPALWPDAARRTHPYLPRRNA